MFLICSLGCASMRIPCSTEGANRWRLLAEQGRRLRVRPRQSGLRGPRETPPGPTTWVRPATGWWERMNAGESPRNQGRSVCRPPLSVSRRRSRGLRKLPRRGADRRAGPRHGPAVPFRRRDRPNRKAATVRRSAQRLSALCPLGSGGIPQRRPGARSPGALEFGAIAVQMARLLRGACHRAGQRPDPLARNDGGYVVAKR